MKLAPQQVGAVRAALDRPAADVRLYLLHGPDEATALDHAARLGRAVGAGAERVDLDAAVLRGDPGRLADEAAALSLFGERRWIRLTGAGEDCLEAATLLLAAERAGNPVAMIAPGVRASGKLVTLATSSHAAVSIGCYPPDARAAEQLAGEIARAHGLQPVGGAARLLVEAAGGDRAVLAREIEKLALFLDADVDRVRELDERTLAAVGADLGDTGVDDMVAALVAGRPAELGAELQRLREAGVSPIPWLRALARRLILLTETRLELARNGDASGLLKRRGVRFGEGAAIMAAARRWTGPMLARALARTQAAARAEMASGSAGAMLAGATALAMAQAAERRGQ